MTAAVPGRTAPLSQVDGHLSLSPHDATKPPGQGGFVYEEGRSAVGRAGRQSEHTLGPERALGMTGQERHHSSLRSLAGRGEDST